MELVQASGLYQISLGQCAMIGVGLLLLYLAIARRFEPLLLVPIGFGGILANIPGVEIATGDGILHLIYLVGVDTAVFPLLVFMGIGALTDFGPLLANPRTLILGAAAQFGIFGTLLGAVGLTQLGIMDFTLREAAAISIIGGADGPTAIYVAEQLAPHLMGAIAVAAYSYMALVPLVQPPIMRLLTTAEERRIEMTQLREVSRRERILFPLVLLIVVALVLPTAAPLLGMFCFGNHLAARPCRLLRWHGQRRAHGQADEPLVANAGQSGDWRRWRLGGAHGSAGRQSHRARRQPPKPSADARHGAERGGRCRLCGGGGRVDPVCELGLTGHWLQELLNLNALYQYGFVAFG